MENSTYRYFSAKCHLSATFLHFDTILTSYLLITG